MPRRLIPNRPVWLLLIILASLVVLAALGCLLVVVSGSSRWAEARAMVEREGETLVFHELLPATPPDAENLLALEPLRGIAEVVNGDNQQGMPGAKRRAIEAMKWSGNSPAMRGVPQGKATDFQEWTAFLRDWKVLDLPEGAAATGHEVLAALDQKFPLLRQLADEAPRRSQAAFLPGLPERDMPELLVTMPVPHYNNAQTLGRMLQLRALAAVNADQGGEAARCILALQRLAAAAKAERMLIAVLVGQTLDALSIEALWQGLQAHVFGGEELRMLQQAWAPHDPAGAALMSLRGEMAVHVQTLEQMQRGVRDVIAEKQLVGGFPNRAQVMKLLIDHWMASLVEREMRIIQMLKAEGLFAAMEEAAQIDMELKNTRLRRWRLDLLMVHLMLPSYEIVIRFALESEARRSQAHAAIALERHRLRHGACPDSMEALIPEFLPDLPLDPCSGRPLRYRRDEKGAFRLWSVALDRKDDDGRVNLDPAAASSSKALRQRGYLGDWAWQYEPVK